MSAPKVKPVLRLVPNGTVGGRLRMTLIATPVGADDGFEFDQWPQMIRNRILASVPQDEEGRDQISIRLSGTPSEAASSEDFGLVLQPRASEDFQKKLDDAWKAIVPRGKDELWDKLLETIHLSLASRSFQNALDDKPAANPAAPAEGTHSAPAIDPAKQLTIKTVLPVKHGDLALLLEFERARRVIDLLDGKVKRKPAHISRAPSLGDPDAGKLVDDAKNQAKQDKATGKTLDDEVVKQKRAELQNAIDALRDERANSASAVCQVLKKPDVTALSREDKSGKTALASHTAATWEQQAARAPAADKPDEQRDLVIQCYQAIVSSPAWARFFGFAFDIEMELTRGLPSWISTGPASVKVKMKDAEQSVGRAWAALDEAGWPKSDDTRGGLSQGLFLMGADCQADDTLPRYDVVTLDVRQATEALVRPLDYSGQQDRGFQTAGMTLIDRRRAEDVRTQIRRTSDEKDTQEIQLFAQDLVIGRRLDAGIRTDAGIVWRALGSKLVTYGLRRDDAAGNDDFDVIDRSIADTVLQRQAAGVLTLDEAIVSPSARLTPTPGGGASDKDVYVDEAFATWSGAPMGVNTAPKIGPDDKTTLSFLQKQSLPSTRAEAGALAPPLRYGRSYRFGMRAVFLGGQSRSVADATKLYEDKTQSYTYPRDPSENRQIPLRRFLRQEPIGAPVVLLPGSVLREKINEMDFGYVESAILRSLPDDYETPDLPKIVNGRPYVPAKDRVSPDEVVRIFVPPQAALDQLLRAGVFDAEQGRGDAALGGLRDIAFGVFEPLVKTKEPSNSQGAFPIAMIDEQRAFDQMPTRRKLAPGWSAAPPDNQQPAVRGAAIFVGRSTFAGYGGPNFVPKPYYPDPYARQLILRLRSRSDDRYLGPAAKVPVYDGKSVYPHAMPTIVVIKKAQEQSSAAAIATPTLTYTDGTTFSGKVGQRAQRVEVTLTRGDDLYLEAFYLTDEKSLATHFALTETIGAYKFSEAGGAEAVADHVTTGFFDVPDDDTLINHAADLVSFACGEGKYVGAGAPLEELAGVFSMRIAHAVNRPLAPASFQDQAESYRIYRKGFDTSRCVNKLAIDPDFDGTPPTNTSPDAERRHRPSGLGLTEIKLSDLANLEADLKDSTDTHNYVLSGRIAFDRRTTSAVEILASCVSPREVLMDDPSRRRPPKARVAGAWPKETVTVDEKGNAIAPERRPASELGVYGFEKIDVKTGSVTLHRSEVTLLRIDSIGDPGAGPLTVEPPGSASGTPSESMIELSLAHISAQIGKRVTDSTSGAQLFSASQQHIFPDGKARQLRLRLRAVSRFGPDFETTGRWTGADGRSQPVVRLRQPLAPSEQSVESMAAVAALGESQDNDGKTITIWLPSSSRPAKCAPLSPVPVFRFTSGNDGAAVSTKRINGVRIYLERGWFSSGEGERLGVVLLPSDVVNQAGDEFLADDRFGPIGSYVTRWGGDPIRKDYAPLTTGLTAAAFISPEMPASQRPQFVTGVAIPVQIPKPPGAADNVTVLETADLLTYEPRFDVDREQWFVDLDLQCPETPNLFVRFGLVRYQENTIDDDLRASEPVVVWSQLLPQRTLTARMSKCLRPPEAMDKPRTVGGNKPDSAGISMLKIIARVTGPTHQSVRVPQKPVRKGMPEDDLAALQRPKVRFRLVHESGDTTALRRVQIGDDGEAALASESPTIKDFEACKPGKKVLSGNKNSHTEDVCVFDVDQADFAALGPGTVYVYAEEIETFMPATYASEPVTVEDIFGPQTFTESGPRFAARLNLFSLPEVDPALK
ncbi:hypothetical protein [Mesorhizobium sp. LNJC403B00]|uniref:hypothetical protein n=1 Tax=Mesorhizobium sp. LNJC403B00 TaxID=1287280 RepID=UPI0003CED461|nr:hypothetical protein [Mesorhizobium sp. LNJC403B00]ESX86267.1 hypothetical protein X754_28880 [Mesorhizobium sp. LNJC403B00]